MIRSPLFGSRAAAPGRAAAAGRTAAVALWAVAALWALAGCGERPPSAPADPIAQGPAGGEAATGDAAAAPEPPPSAGAPDDPPPGARDGQPQDTAQASSQQTLSPSPQAPTLDSLARAVQGLADAQMRLLERLDSLGGAEAARAAAAAGAEAAADTADIAGQATDAARGIGVNILWSVLLILVFHFAIRGLSWILETLAERTVARRLSFKWVIPIVRMTLWAIAAYLIVRVVFRVDDDGLLAAGAAAGVAIAIAAQDLLKNVLGGLLVVLDKPFQVGDKISVHGTYGEVVSIGLRTTRIVTADDNLVSVPNAQVVGEQVANANAGKLNCQVVTDLHLPGRVDERAAKRIAFDAAVTSQYVYLDKPIAVFVDDLFRTTFVTRIRVRAYVLDPRFEFLLRSDITERARDGFRKAGLMPDGVWPTHPHMGTPEDGGANDE